MSSQRRSSSRPRWISSPMNALRRRGPARRSISATRSSSSAMCKRMGLRIRWKAHTRPRAVLVVAQSLAAPAGAGVVTLVRRLRRSGGPYRQEASAEAQTGRISFRSGAFPATMEPTWAPLSHARPAVRHHPRLPRSRSSDRRAAPCRCDARAGESDRLHRSAARGQVDVPVPAGAEAARPRRVARQHPVRELLRRPPPPSAA